MTSRSNPSSSSVIGVASQLKDALEILSSTRHFYTLRKDFRSRIAGSRRWVRHRLQRHSVLKWIAESETRAAASVTTWLSTVEMIPMAQVSTPIMDHFQLRRINIVTRSQILRAFESLSPEELEDYRKETEEMIRRWQVESRTITLLLHPETATGTVRLLRPPDLEVQSIRAPPQYLERSHPEANSEEYEHEYFSANTIAGTTNEERNKTCSERRYLACGILALL